MATKHSIPQSNEDQAVSFVLEDGVHYEPTYNEYVVIVDGDEVAWARTQGQAWRSYHEILRVDREHVERNPANAPRAILVNHPNGTVSVVEVA